MLRLARCLHFDSQVPNQPQWDTLIGVCNPYLDPVGVIVHCFDLDGNEVGQLAFNVDPGHSLATTFIKGNVLPNPPQNWNGDAIIEFTGSTPLATPPVLPIAACLGGGGPAPQNWNGASPSVHLFGSPQVINGPGRRWVFPYCIPFFSDPVQHAGDKEYRAGLFLRNLGTAQADLTLTYTVGDTYGNVGEQLTCQFTIDPGKALSKQIHELLPGVLTMNPRDDGTYEGSEGWIDITSPADAELGTWLECANAGYESFGFSQAAWII